MTGEILTGPMGNIEAAARDICSKQMPGMSGAELAAYVDYYWHCVAAQLESGQIDGAGNQIENVGLVNGLEAYRDWCQRHPESKQASIKRPPT